MFSQPFLKITPSCNTVIIHKYAKRRYIKREFDSCSISKKNDRLVYAMSITKLIENICIVRCDFSNYKFRISY